MQGVPPNEAQRLKPVRIVTWTSLVVGLLLTGVLIALLPRSGQAAGSLLQQTPRTRIGEWTLTAVGDWQQGLTNGLLISNNAGGELRLDADISEGSFISDPVSTTLTANAAGAFWRADFPPGTDIELEMRGRSSPPPPGDIATAEGWGPWRPLIAADARSQAIDGAYATADVVDFPLGVNYLQVRVRFSSDTPRASAILTELTIAYLDATEGLEVAPDFLRVPINVGPATLTAPPREVPRARWGVGQLDVRPDRATPRGIILHQIDTTLPATATLSFLRALASYQIEVLGWDDLVYHYVIDEAGTLYEGRLGGAAAAVSRLGADDRVVHVALLGSLEEPPGSETRQTLIDLLAWIGQAYDIPPTGEHRVLVGDTITTRPNIVAHSEVVSQAPDPGAALLDLLPEIRTRANNATVRARWFFVEGNVRDYTQRLAFLNPAEEATNATITLVQNESEPITRSVSLDANGGRAVLTVNNIISDTTDLTWIIEASEPIITQRTTGLASDIDTRFGAQHPSRVWYFAEGSTAGSFQTFLVLFNPQDSDAEATITYIQSDGALAEQKVGLGARQRLGINVGDVLPGVSFGARVVASQPIVAERTMLFGADNTGMHSSPGIKELSQEWYFAEGSTQAPFDMRLLLLNPNRQSTIASVTFMTRDGTSLTRRYAIPATTRLVVDVNEVVPELGVATLVQSDRPLAAERSLYISFAPEGEDGEEGAPLPAVMPQMIGTVSAGATEPAYSWWFADGRVADAQQYLLLSNPSRGQARVTVEFLLAGAERSTQSIVMPAGSRYTLAVSELYPDVPTVAAIVRSTQPVVVERSIFPTSGVGAGGGTTSLGMPGE